MSEDKPDYVKCSRCGHLMPSAGLMGRSRRPVCESCKVRSQRRRKRGKKR